ncbi:hypothetical protein [Paenibacillus lutrae]|uniref:S-adenosylmethionine decarboxylase n=1 Tax=Paenibacillus lutrae TaxID=2078573 RepID=A0A7X3FIQ8_9BACL|nr:hypothetical protein [Paenibacillus lutrae]
MRSQLKKKLIVGLLLAGLLAWPLTSLYGYATRHEDNPDAERLLYQVSLFQIELLNRFLQDSAQPMDTRQLDSLKQTLYSASYTHERLVLALGKDNVNPLHSLPLFMQYILRLQIGGERALKAEEKNVLQEAAKLFAGLHEAYGKLMASSGSIVSSQSKTVSEIDEKLNSLLEKKLLQ